LTIVIRETSICGRRASIVRAAGAAGGPVADKKKCFVLMGFGVKVDYKTNRSLDLDKTYSIIRRAVEGAGLECVRADDIVHSGVIDKPMYENLLDADVAIADLSTSNENAIYELGVRHALKPWTTIVIAENKFKFPFDLGHILVRHYEHLGTGIDYDEAVRLEKELKNAIEKISAGQEVDSPVYTFLPDLVQPMLRVAMKLATPPAGGDAADADTPNLSALNDLFKAAKKEGDFLMAKKIIEKMREMNKDDVYLIQQHALATYKSGSPSPLEALSEAKQILEQLHPRTSGDVETLGLWGAIHKRLWEATGDRAALDEGVWVYERAFVMKLDHYTGINCAYMLDDRARLQTDPSEATADHVVARRIRRRLLEIVDTALRTMPRDAAGNTQVEQWYWLEATKVEAMLGLGDPGFAAARDELFAKAPEPWMKTATEEQLSKLASRLAQ
jgi:hypothetical protein